MMSETFVVVHRATIIAAAARYKVPTVFPALFYAREGGLVSYGPSVSVMFRGAAGYVDRILRGEKPAELPVQVPTKWERRSISRLRRRLVSKCPPRCSPAPTR